MDIVGLGKLIKTLRKEKNMTQEDLASKLGVTISAISKWETGKNSPDMTMLQKLSEILRVSLEEIYNPENTLSRLASCNSQKTNPPVPKQQADISETNMEAIDTAKEVTPNKPSGTLRKYKGIVLSIAILLILVSVGFTISSLKAKSKELNIRSYACRIAEDEHCGTVYETACIYSGDLESLTQEDPYIQQLSTAWKNNTDIEETVIILKVSFYSSEEQAQNWDTPQKVIYLVR